MRAVFGSTVGKARFLGSAVAAIVALGLVCSLVYAGYTSNLSMLSVREDGFYNYDFISPSVSSWNVDWPVTMLFWWDAEIDKVKFMYGESLPMGARIYARLNDGAGWIWDSDCGIKGLVWSSDLNGYVQLHMRLYAPNPPDYMHNIVYRNYVLGTTHYDNWPIEDWSGYSEWAEADWASRADSSCFVFEDWASYYNVEEYRIEGGHIWLNDGYATIVRMP